MARKKIFIVFASLVLLLVCSGSAFAIYVWVDEKGVTHISDQPSPGKPQEKELSEPETARKSAAPVSPGQSSDAVRAPAPGEQPKQTSTAAPVDAAAPRKDPSVAVQEQQPKSRTGIATTNPLPATATEPAPAAGPEAARSIPLPSPRAAAPNSAAVKGVIAAFFSMFLAALALAYAYFSLCLFLIARKLDVPAAWVAWVPVIQLWVFTATAGKPGWWALLFLVPIVNIVVLTYLWMCIVENLGREKWFGLLMLVPIVNVVYLGMLAFSGSNSKDAAVPA